MEMVHAGIAALLRSAVTGEALPLPEGFSLEEADKIVRRQGLTPLVYQGALNCGVSQSDPVMMGYNGKCYVNLVRTERQKLAAEAVLEALEGAGIDHMPVKGCVLKGLYPRQELRVMGDADILIRVEDEPRLRQVMEGLGFRQTGDNVHVYEWDGDALHVELHKSLVPPEDGEFYGYYGTGWRLAKQTRGSRFDLSPEDMYLFLLTHFARHYRRSGIGCRHVVDLYVWRRAYPRMDGEYLERELKKLGLREFEQNICRLLRVWFEGAETDPVTELMTQAVFHGGSWGSGENAMLSNALRSRNRGRDLLRMIFPDRDFLSYRYPVLTKHPWLLPLIWPVRWLVILFKRPGNIKKKMDVWQDMDPEKIRSHEKALRAVGLEYRK